MLDWIEFGTVGRLKDQANIISNGQIFRVMPACLINLHDDEILREGLAHLLQEEIHHGSGSLRQNQRDHLAKGWRHSGVGVDVLSYDLCRYVRTHPWRGPTALCTADAAKTAFILRYDQNWPLICRFSCDNCCFNLR